LYLKFGTILLQRSKIELIAQKTQKSNLKRKYMQTKKVLTFSKEK